MTTWTVYLSGEIHSDWRERIVEGAVALDLPVAFAAPVTDHDASDNCGVAILGSEASPFWKDHKGAKLNGIRTRSLIQKADIVVVRFGDRYKQWNAAFDAGFAAALGKRGPTATYAEAAAAYRASFDRHTYTDADVPALFTDLRERDVRVGVLSNTMWPRDWHRELFARDGVLELIDGDVYSSEIPHTKPHELAFRKAMAAVGADDPSRCGFGGYRPYDDISGARAIGMRTIFVPHSNIPAAQQVPVDVSPDAVVQRLTEVVVHVDGWRNGGG